MKTKYKFELAVMHRMGSISIAYADNKETLKILIRQNLQRCNGLHGTYYKIYEHV